MAGGGGRERLVATPAATLSGLLQQAPKHTSTRGVALS